MQGIKGAVYQCEEHDYNARPQTRYEKQTNLNDALDKVFNYCNGQSDSDNMPVYMREARLNACVNKLSADVEKYKLGNSEHITAI